MTHAPHLTRRQTLKAAGAAVGAAVLPVAVGAVAVPSAMAATGAPLTPELTEGPYWVDTKLRRSDIRHNVDGTDR